MTKQLLDQLLNLQIFQSTICFNHLRSVQSTKQIQTHKQPLWIYVYKYIEVCVHCNGFSSPSDRDRPHSVLRSLCYCQERTHCPLKLIMLLLFSLKTHISSSWPPQCIFIQNKADGLYPPSLTLWKRDVLHQVQTEMTTTTATKLSA